MDIYLVRHGEAAASWGEDPDPGLSATGLQQAKYVAETLVPSVDANTLLISSPLKRAMETAGPLATRLALEVREDAAFREVPAPVPLPQRQQWLRRFMAQQWSEQGDELLAWRDTAMAQLLALEASTVVFTHFLVINAVVGRLLGHEETLCFYPDNGSVTHLRQQGGKLELIQLGAEMKTRVN